jgi:hypothetical protein
LEIEFEDENQGLRASGEKLYNKMLPMFEGHGRYSGARESGEQFKTPTTCSMTSKYFPVSQAFTLVLKL